MSLERFASRGAPLLLLSNAVVRWSRSRATANATFFGSRGRAVWQHSVFYVVRSRRGSQIPCLRGALARLLSSAMFYGARALAAQRMLCFTVVGVSLHVSLYV